MSASGAFRTVAEHEVETTTAARALVDKHAAANGMRPESVKMIDGADPDGARYTATTAGGRAGRNIAFLDY